MIYVLDEVICYCPEDGTIKVLDGSDQDMTVLTPVPNRILHFLVENQGRVISREMFLTQVWDNHGKVGSTNSLKQNIGLIRKVLDSYLDKPSIMTIPYQGYILSNEVSLKKIVETNKKNNSNVLPNENIDFHEVKVIKGKAVPSEKIFWLSFCFLMIILFLYAILKSATYSVHVKSYELLDINNCNIYSLAPYNNVTDKNNAQNNARNIIDRLSPNCSKKDLLIYHSNGHLQNNVEKPSKLLIQCSNVFPKDTGCLTYRTNR